MSAECRGYRGRPGPLAGVQTAQATRDLAMALTRDFKETIQARIERDPAVREELLKEGVECLLSGDVDTVDWRTAGNRLPGQEWRRMSGQCRSDVTGRDACDNAGRKRYTEITDNNIFYY